MKKLLSDNKIEIEEQSKLAFSVNNKSSFKKSIDFCIKIKGKDNKKPIKIFIEIDEPSHFSDKEYTTKNTSTAIRDFITISRLKEEQENNPDIDIMYTTLTPQDIRELEKKSDEEKINYIISKNIISSEQE